jgi:hypothetical protein
LKCKVIENIFGTALYLIQAANYTALLQKEAVTNAIALLHGQNISLLKLDTQAATPEGI